MVIRLAALELMRILLTTRGSAGHLLPLAPVAHACIDAGHDVMVAAQGQHQAYVDGPVR
jgi:UDP:flavonoid glycosyltransferase YjiC (YdhE family)